MKRLDRLLRDVVEQFEKTNKKLDLVASLLVSNQLLDECISPDGQVRGPQEVAEIVGESFCAGMCLFEEMQERQKEFEYQKNEFFVEESSEEEIKKKIDELLHKDDEDDEDDSGKGPPPVMNF